MCKRYAWALRHHSVHCYYYQEQRKTVCAPNSEIMIHQPLGGAQGQATEIEITAKRILKLKHDINKMIAEKQANRLKE